MKRIIGKKMHCDQCDTTLSGMGIYHIDQLNPDMVDVSKMPMRFGWAASTVAARRAGGFVPYRWLDIGSYTGSMAIIAARTKLNPSEPKNAHVRTVVDAIEANKEAFGILDAMANENTDTLTINAFNVHFEDFETDKQYSVITAFEILEHTKDPLFCVEKIYDLLEIGGILFVTVPEENGAHYGVQDHNPWHYWTTTIQSMVGIMFRDERRWHIVQIFESDGLIHAEIHKRVLTL